MKKWIGFTLVLLIVILFTACNSEKENNSKEQTTKYNIYYIDSKTSKIVTEEYSAVGTTKEQLVKELLSEIREEPENMVYKKALPDNVTIKEFSFSEDDQLTINFDSTYNDLVGIPEVLCRATIVKTLSQIEGIEYVVFYVSGQRLVDSNGNVVKLMTEKDFIESTGAETSYKVTVYFSNEKGKALVANTMNIYYTELDSIEELVIKQLINGPTKIGMYETIPEGTTLLNVKTKEGICYIDFNEKFLEKIPDIDDEIAIYSVVNTLVELSNINKVQFNINGAVQEIYGENIAFDGLLERDLSLIEGSK